MTVTWEPKTDTLGETIVYEYDHDVGKPYSSDSEDVEELGWLTKKETMQHADQIGASFKII